MKYKVGDKVKIKSLDWYNSNKDALGNIDCGNYHFIDEMVMYCGKTLTVECVHLDSYDFTEDLYRFVWTDDMIDCLVEHVTTNEPPKMVSIDKVCDWLKENIDAYSYVTIKENSIPEIVLTADFEHRFRKEMEE